MIYDKLPVVFLSAVASEKNGSTNSQIATYILDHLETVKNLGIKELAKECHVAISSISRFCKEIGLNDFVELRELLLSTNLHFQQASASLQTKQRVKDYRLKIDECIKMVEESLDYNSVKEICKDIKKYPQVGIFGLMKAGSVAFNLQSDLLMLGKQVYTNISYSQQIEYIMNADETDLIIIFSYTGSYFEYQNLRHLKNKLKTPRIWLIASGNTTYPEYIDKVISFNSLKDQLSHPYQLQFIAGLIAQEYASAL